MEISRLVFVCCGIGLNVTFAIYLAYINIFAVAFTSRRIMGWMNACIYVSAFSIVGLQMRFSHYFDRYLGCKAWSTFQIMAGLLVMTATLLAIPFASSVYHVYLFGVLIGIFEGSALSALQMLACAVHTDMTKFVNTGFTVAQVLPIVLSFFLDFHDAKSGHSSAIAFAAIPALFCVSTVVMFLVAVYYLGSFDSAFARLEAQSAAGHLNNASGDDFADDNESRPLFVNKKDTEHSIWIHRPVLTCALVNFIAHALSMFFMPFLTFIGSMQTAHLLVLVRFGGEFLGRISAHYISLDMLERWGQLDRNRFSVLVSLTMFRAVVLCVLILGIFNVVDIGDGIFLMGLTAFFYFIFAWTNSEVMAVVTKFAPKEKEQEVMNGMMFLTFGAQLFSLAVGQFVVYEHMISSAQTATLSSPAQATTFFVAEPIWLSNPVLSPN